MQNLKKIILSLGVVLAFIAYSWQQRHDSSPTIETPPDINPASPTTANVSSGASSGQTSTPSASAKYKDGTYTGSVEDAYYGDIQVQAVVSGGKITDVKFLKYPDDQENSIYINQQAMPYLRQEAIAAQSSDVNIITGATDTAQAFIRSMDDALNQARRG
ncbi:MAG TPA: FMN-binding protein [Candidatus Saccharimonadales bacterium]|nr:FMN-binding protein [Candidatus Saccharimonadales bacterium]